MIVNNNSEILYLYEAKMCNPNGDPDNENKPRMDWATQRNLVSDVRLKRYVRDWLKSRGYEIFVTDVDGKAVEAYERVAEVFKDYDKLPIKEFGSEEKKMILDYFIDVRMFGATMPIKQGDIFKSNANLNFTGPIQFTWGYSLNKAELLDSPSITSRLKTGGTKSQGTIGKDWRIKYSLIAFYGVVSRWNALHTELSEEDIELLDQAMKNALVEMAATRSKIGQRPVLYLRIQWKDGERFIGDLRNYLKFVDSSSGLNDWNELSISLEDDGESNNTLYTGKLLRLVEGKKDAIDKVVVLWDPKFAEFLKELKSMVIVEEV